MRLSLGVLRFVYFVLSRTYPRFHFRSNNLHFKANACPKMVTVASHIISNVFDLDFAHSQFELQYDFSRRILLTGFEV